MEARCRRQGSAVISRRFARWFALAWACGLLALTTLAHAAETLATLTMQQGKASVIRGASRLEATPGARLMAEDIIETADATALLRIEFDDGKLLDLGPATRVMVSPRWTTSPGTNGALAYVLDGWVKLSRGESKASTTTLLASPSLDVSAASSAVVLHMHGSDAEAFAESGKVMLLANTRAKAGRPAEVHLSPGQFLARHGDEPATVTARPSSAFIQNVPGAFMDSLSARAALFKGKNLSLTATSERLTYADVQAWLDAEPRIRQRFTTRWKPVDSTWIVASEMSSVQIRDTLKSLLA
ncbi:MAG: hypothetical protein EOP38_07120, partial [Rubrivivax sp.]